jgi:hypothetical protein
MTRFEELSDIINKNKTKSKSKKKQEDLLEVSGLTESAQSGQPRMEFAYTETDMPLTDQLYRNPKHKPNDGSGASYWDQD